MTNEIVSGRTVKDVDVEPYRIKSTARTKHGCGTIGKGA